MASKCRNGPSCPYLARGICMFRHSRNLGRNGEEEQSVVAEERAVAAFNAVMAVRLQKEDMKTLFEKLIDPEVPETCLKYLEDEILRRIGKSDEEECLKVLQETVGREEERFKSLEEKALEVMTRSYSYFSETIWTRYAYKELSFEAFKKLASEAKKARVIWDTSSYSKYCIDDSDDSNSESEYGQLSDMKEEFKSILVWVEREDIDQSRRDLVMAVFKTGVRKSRASVLKWMRHKIATWERKEREEEEEMKRIDAKVKRDIALGIPFSSGIPGGRGRKLDARMKELRDLKTIENPRAREARLVEIMNQMKVDQSDSEDEEEYYKSLDRQFIANHLANRM